jgi:hypothetical protein
MYYGSLLIFMTFVLGVTGCIHTDRQTRLEKRQTEGVELAIGQTRFEQEQRQNLVTDREEGWSAKEIVGAARGIAQGARDTLRSRHGR